MLARGCSSLARFGLVTVNSSPFCVPGHGVATGSTPSVEHSRVFAMGWNWGKHEQVVWLCVETGWPQRINGGASRGSGGFVERRQGGSEVGVGGGPFSWTCKSSSSLRLFGFIASIDHSFLGAAAPKLP